VIFVEVLIVLTQGNNKHDCLYVIEEMDPFLSLVPLAPNIENGELCAVNDERLFYYTCRPDTTPKNVIITRDIVFGCNSTAKKDNIDQKNVSRYQL
jgi:hypothetical protein